MLILYYFISNLKHNSHMPHAVLHDSEVLHAVLHNEKIFYVKWRLNVNHLEKHFLTLNLTKLEFYYLGVQATTTIWFCFYLV